MLIQVQYIEGLALHFIVEGDIFILKVVTHFSEFPDLLVEMLLIEVKLFISVFKIPGLVLKLISDELLGFSGPLLVLIFGDNVFFAG